MAQPSVASFFNNRKRSALEDTKINQAKKVLVLDAAHIKSERVVITQNPVNSPNNTVLSEQETIEKVIATKRIIINSTIETTKNVVKKVVRTPRTKKTKNASKTKDIQVLFNNMNAEKQNKTDIPDNEGFITPPSTPKKLQNAMDKVHNLPEGPSLKEIKNKMSRSARLTELKASLKRFQENDKKLSEIEKKTSQIGDSPKLLNFRTIELEVQTSPRKVFSPEKAYLSPKKSTTGVRRNLLNILSPTKNAVPASTHSPSKEIQQETSQPALSLPFKYRFLIEIFRSIDTVTQILFNRKETITFRKLKPAVEEMLKRNLMERHLAQIKTIYPEAYTFSQEKLKVFGTGMKTEQWELVLKPVIKGENMTSEVLLERRRTLFGSLLDRVKDYHHEFLMSLDTPIHIPKSTITRWHPEFDLERVPDVETAMLPQAPQEDKVTTGKEVLERARVLFHCNARMEQALQKLEERKKLNSPLPPAVKPKEMPESVLKGIPKALLEKVRQRQAAKALLSMTRSADKEKEVQLYSRLPEIARLTRNLFVSEKKSVLPLETVTAKLENCYKGNLNRTEMEEHLKVIVKEVPSWLAFHDIRNCTWVKLSKNADLSLIINKLEELCKMKNET